MDTPVVALVDMGLQPPRETGPGAPLCQEELKNAACTRRHGLRSFCGGRLSRVREVQPAPDHVSTTELWPLRASFFLSYKYAL